MLDGIHERVLQANIVYHSALANDYDAKQPHFLSENLQRVEKILIDLSARTRGECLLDLGCGTGFILNLARKYFRHVVGVDVTEAMLHRVDCSAGNVTLFRADTNDLGFLQQESFDVCTAYGFLHHLVDVEPTLRQAYCSLRRGGLFYSDQDPNARFWQFMQGFRSDPALPDVVRREVQAVAGFSGEIAEDANLQEDVVSLAEYRKTSEGGFDADAMVHSLRAIGFSTAEYRYEWFLGEGKIRHRGSMDELRLVEDYLRGCLPATAQLFKYVAFYAEK